MADISITAANVKPGTVAQIQQVKYGSAGITQGMALYHDVVTDKFKKSNAETSVATAAASAFALTPGGDNDTGVVCKGGYIDFGSAILTKGVEYALSDTDGGIMPVGDFGSNDNMTALGLAVSTSVLKISFNVTGVTHS